MQQVICHKCRCPNQFGTVFCRNCGEKLKSQDRNHPSRNKSNKAKKIIVKLVKLALILIALYFVLGLFVTWGLPKEPSVTEEREVTETQKKCHEIDIALARKRSAAMFAFSPEQLTYAANYLVSDRPPVKIPGGGSYSMDANPFDSGSSGSLGETSMGEKQSLGETNMGKSGGLSGNTDFGGTEQPQAEAPPKPPTLQERRAKNKQQEKENDSKAITVNYSFSVDKDLNLHIVLRGILLDYVPYRFEIVGAPGLVGIDEKDPEKKAMTFDLKSARFGYISIPTMLKSHIMSLFENMAFCDELKKSKGYFSKIKSVVVQKPDLVEVTFGVDK